MGLLTAMQDGNNEAFNQALQDAARAGVNLKTLKQLRVPGDIVLFRALPAADQEAILRQANDDEKKRYLPFTHRQARIDLAHERQAAE
jgi:hypothetical protein